jgi:hypothetical protein
MLIELDQDVCVVDEEGMVATTMVKNWQANSATDCLESRQAATRRTASRQHIFYKRWLWRVGTTMAPNLISFKTSLRVPKFSSDPFQGYDNE